MILGGAIGEKLLRAVCRRPGIPGSDFENRDINLTQRFGQKTLERLRGRKVLDIGCGEGRDVFELCSVGAEGFGVDIQEKSLARARAHKPDLAERFFNASEAPAWNGYFDAVISVNGFEHYPDPKLVLTQMYNYLRPGGFALISFCPPWLHPYGAHLEYMTPLPWPQLIFSEKALMNVRRDYRSDGACRFEDVVGGLNKMTLRKFERFLKESPFTLRKVEYRAIKGINVLTALPLVREFTCSVIRAELEKN